MAFSIFKANGVTSKRRRAAVWFQTARLGPFLIVIFCATAARVGWVAHYIAASPVTSQTRPLEEGEIGRIAVNIAEGRGFSSPFGRDLQPTAWECPVVPFLFAAIIKLVGGPTVVAARLIFLLQAIVGGFAAATYCVIARRLTIRYPERFAGWLVPVLAIVVCLWPESVYSVIDIWYLVWQEAAVVVFALFTMVWWDRMNIARSILVGLAGGVLALINVTPLPIIAFAFLFPALKKRPLREVIPPILVAASCFAIVIAPWLVRNAEVFHRIVPLRSNSGFEIFEGNNAIECIREPLNPPNPMTDIKEFERYAKLGEIRYCDESLTRAAKYVRNHPWETLRRTAARIYVSWLTDVTDQWTPYPEQKWWTISWQYTTRYLISTLLIFTSAGVVIWGAVSGRFRLLPYAPLLAAILFFLPLPHYFTLADPEYTAILRMWLGVTAVCLLALRSSASARPLEISKQGRAAH